MQQLLNDIRQIIEDARRHVQRNVNMAMVQTYWHIWKRIVEEEQQGQKRAKYAAEIVQQLSNALIQEFGKGFSATNLRQMRQFFLAYPIQQLKTDEFNTFPNARISWTHYVFLMRLKDPNEICYLKKRFYLWKLFYQYL